MGSGYSASLAASLYPCAEVLLVACLCTSLEFGSTLLISGKSCSQHMQHSRPLRGCNISITGHLGVMLNLISKKGQKRGEMNQFSCLYLVYPQRKIGIHHAEANVKFLPVSCCHPEQFVLDTLDILYLLQSSNPFLTLTTWK